jgi:predicted sugar kinase
MELEIFEAGKIFNPIQGKICKPVLKHKKVKVIVPARLNTMCFDLKTLTKPKKKFIYNAGELAFSANVNTYAKLKITKNKGNFTTISKNTKRKSIVNHASLMMKKALNIKESLFIEANNVYDYPHSGLGSSSSLISVVCIAINEAYGKPLNSRQLTLFIAQNHGEEIELDDEKLIHVQCNGGSPSVALYGGGMQVIVGESNMILREKFPEGFTFVFGLPKIYKKCDAQSLMAIEKSQFPKMLKSSKDFSKEIAWKVLHEIIPSMINKNLRSIGDVLEYYRFKTGSLIIDSRTWRGLYSLVKSLIKYRNLDTPIISVSSCGPAIYVLTKNPIKIEEILKNKGMITFKAKPNNEGYSISYNF